MFDRIHKVYSKYEQSFLRDQELKRIGFEVGKYVLIDFFETELIELKKETNIQSNISLLRGSKIRKLPSLSKIQNLFESKILFKLGRVLSNLGNICLTIEGKNYIENLLGKDINLFKKCLFLGERLVSKKLKKKFHNKAISISKRFLYKLNINFPKFFILKELQKKGLIDNKRHPTFLFHFLKVTDSSIITYYKEIALGLLLYYAPSDNFYDLRSIINYHLRYSLLATLAYKHNTSIRKTIVKYSKNPKIQFLKNKKKFNCLYIQFLTTEEIAKKTRRFFFNLKFFNSNQILQA